jgi:hypothetical protein
MLTLRWRNARPLLSGSPAEAEHAKSEIARRIPLMLQRIDRSTLTVLADPPRLYGLCLSCGESLGATWRGGDCVLCAAARWKTLVQLGRIPA